MSFEPILLTRAPESGREDLSSYRAAGGYRALAKALDEMTPAAVADEITASELRGRGGAGFPTGKKWQLAVATKAESRYVVGNGGEHEPGSRKDRLLLELHAHKIIEGMAIAGYATGATTGYLYLIEDMAEAITAAKAAIAEARAAGILGPRVLDHDVAFDIAITLAPTSYVAGEETAALEVIEGRPPLPREKPPFPGTVGLFGLPTTVNNVETLAHVPSIIDRGADWFRDLGAEGSAGSMLFTLDESVKHPGVYELPFGTTFRELIEGKGGGTRSGKAIRAFLPALSSRYLPAEALDTAMTHRTVRDAGSGLGCGGISLVEEGQCIVERVREIAGFFVDEQCGQCAPCRMETNTIAAVLDKVLAGDAGDYRSQIEKIAGFTAGKGRCSLIEMAAAPVLSALALFPADFAHHAAHGSCR